MWVPTTFLYPVSSVLKTLSRKNFGPLSRVSYPLKIVEITSEQLYCLIAPSWQKPSPTLMYMDYLLTNINKHIPWQFININNVITNLNKIASLDTFKNVSGEHKLKLERLKSFAADKIEVKVKRKSWRSLTAHAESEAVSLTHGVLHTPQFLFLVVTHCAILCRTHRYTTTTTLNTQHWTSLFINKNMAILIWGSALLVNKISWKKVRYTH
jgi:hypothetical protein